MNSQQKIRLGLDIGGTATKCALVDDNGAVLKRVEFPSHAGDGHPEKVRTAIRDALAKELGGFDLISIGIGCAGSIDHKAGVVRESPNFPNWKNVPLCKWVSEDFQVPVLIDNDANCAVIADWKLGAARGASQVVLLTLGTGVGGGLIVNDQILRGATGTAAELGHVSIDQHGIQCPCGNRGCLERYCSASALKALKPNESAKEIFEKANRGVEEYVKIRTDFIFSLSVGITSFLNIFDPEFVVLGGAISQSILPHTDEIYQHIQEHAFSAPAENVKIVGAKFGNLSGALGAALLFQ